MEVAESAAGLLIYKELDYSCIHGGTNFSSISNGIISVGKCELYSEKYSYQ
jgi:hypothetical protein